jgi:hypothetical protein
MKTDRSDEKKNYLHYFYFVVASFLAYTMTHSPFIKVVCLEKVCLGQDGSATDEGF